jgi:Spy/CpxP family protein refolding chaperone
MRGYSSLVLAGLFTGVLGGVSVYGGAAPETGSPEKVEAPSPENTLPLLRGVTLSDEQKTKVREILQSQRPAAQETLKRMLGVQYELGNRILYPGKLDEEQLAPLLEQLLFLQNQIQRQNFRTTLEIRNLLTPEQLAQGAEYRDRMKAQQGQAKPSKDKKN